jgi:hypothetical protein
LGSASLAEGSGRRRALDLSRQHPSRAGSRWEPQVRGGAGASWLVTIDMEAAFRARPSGLVGVHAVVLAILPTPRGQLAAHCPPCLDERLAQRGPRAPRQSLRHCELCLGDAARPGMAAGRRAFPPARHLRVGRPLSVMGRDAAGAAGPQTHASGRALPRGRSLGRRHVYTRPCDGAANVQALFFLASIFASVGVLGANLATGLAAVAVIIIGNGAYLTLLA